MDKKLQEALVYVGVKRRQVEKAWSDRMVYNTPSDIRHIDLIQNIGSPAAFFRIVVNQPSEIWIQKDGGNEIRVRPDLIANVPRIFRNENLIRVRVVPTIYPAVIEYYESGYVEVGGVER